MQSMKKNALMLIVVAFLLLGVTSCTNTPWHKDQADAFLKKGMALIEAGQYNSALKELLEAEKYSPRDPKIKYYLGVAYHGRGIQDFAVESFKKAVALKRDYSEAHNYLGTLYMDMGQWDQAIASFDRALANHLYDTPALALYNSGWAYYNLKDYPKALSRYQQALRHDVLGVLRPQIEKNIGLIYMAESKLVLAIEHFRNAVDLEPAMYDAHYFLGECYLKIKDNVNARKAFLEVVALSPKSAFGQKARDYLQSIR